MPIFDKYFGHIDSRHLSGSSTVCAVGFEPNPKHSKILKDLQNSYKKCGWKAKFYTETAASHSNGNATLYTDANEVMLEWGASIIKSKVAKKPVGVVQ